MITGFTLLSAGQYGDILESTHKLRHKTFIQSCEWDMPTWRGMEYDQYDNLSMAYMAWQDEQGVVRGTCRMAPTDRPYMIKDHWPHLIQDIELPSSIKIWEASRLGVDPNVGGAKRKEIIASLICAYQYFGLVNDIEYMIGVMPPNIWDRVFRRFGWDVEEIGPRIELYPGEGECVACKMVMSIEILKNILEINGFSEPPMKFAPDLYDIFEHKNLAKKEKIPAKELKIA